MNKKIWTEEKLINAVKNNVSYAGVLRELGLKPAGSNYDTIKREIKRLKLDTSHMTGQAWNSGNNYRPIRKARPLSKVLVVNSTWINSNNLRKRLIKEGYKEHRCERCERTEWFGLPIPLELHHINGIKSDLRIENLQVLCPNCHALTDTYRGKHK